jgi:hypothetical protein
MMKQSILAIFTNDLNLHVSFFILMNHLHPLFGCERPQTELYLIGCFRELRKYLPAAAANISYGHAYASLLEIIPSYSPQKWPY